MSIVRLDHEEDIYLDVTSDIERTKRLRSCAKEPETVAWVHAIPASAVLYDVGANVGAYSLVAATRGVQVVAFEPHPPTYRHLLRNIELNEVGSRVQAEPFALSSGIGEVGISWSSGEPGAACHTYSEDGERIPCVTLDAYAYAGSALPPTHVKIDTDGHEVSVIMGGMDTLSRVMSVLVEVDDSLPDRERIDELLTHAGLHCDARVRHGSTPISNHIYSR